MADVSRLPIVSVQPTLRDVIKDVRAGVVPSDTFWLSYYKQSESSVHSKVQVTLDEVDRDLVVLEGADGIQFKKLSGGDTAYLVSSEGRFPETKLLLPTHEYADPHRSNLQHPHRITAFDIAPDGSQFATGFLDGSVHIYSSEKKTPPKETAFGKVHKSTASSLQFFPSSRVILSAGADFTLCILPADPDPATTALKSARTMLGHRRAITSTAIVDRGRNVLSSSLDGTVRLWDVSSGEKIHTLASGSGGFSPVTSMSLGDAAGVSYPNPLGPAPGAPDPREVSTDGKTVFCAFQDRTFEVFDLGSRTSVFRSPAGPAPLTKIAYSVGESLLATGTSTGVVDLWDTRSLGAPLTSFMRGEAGVCDLQFRGRTLLVGTDDGLPFAARLTAEGTVNVETELVGADCDPTRSIRAVGGNVWTAADDGRVRMYLA